MNIGGLISQIMGAVMPLVQAVVQALPGIIQTIVQAIGGIVNGLGGGNGGTAAGTGLAVGLAGALAAGAATGGGAVKNQPQLLGPGAATTTTTQTTGQTNLQSQGPISAGLDNGTQPPATTATVQDGVFRSNPPGLSANQDPQKVQI